MKTVTAAGSEQKVIMDGKIHFKKLFIIGLRCFQKRLNLIAATANCLSYHCFPCWRNNTKIIV